MKRLRDKLKTAAVEVIKQPETGPPVVIGQDIGLFDYIYGEQRAARNERDGIRYLTGAEAEEHLKGMSDAQRAGYRAQAELHQQRNQGGDRG